MKDADPGIAEVEDAKKRLFNQFRGLERRTRSGGKDIVDHFPGGHDDLANAVAGVCVKSVTKKHAGWAFYDAKEDEWIETCFDHESRGSKTAIFLY